MFTGHSAPCMPETESVQVHDGFVTAFDFRTRNPKWVLEHITAESLNGTAERCAPVHEPSLHARA
eukprot:scaffold64379_cov24-Tisochrysis_lutea.AAC.1